MAPVGLVLAAGGGRRFGGPKAPALVEGTRLVDRAVGVLLAGGCPACIVVLGAWAGAVPGALIVANPLWASGLGSSLRAGLAELERWQGCDRAVVTLADLPGVTPAAVRRVLASPDRLAAAGYEGVRGHPVVLGREHWAAVRTAATGDRGARDYLACAGAALIEVGDLACGVDLDSSPARDGVLREAIGPRIDVGVAMARGGTG